MGLFSDIGNAVNKAVNAASSVVDNAILNPVGAISTAVTGVSQSTQLAIGGAVGSIVALTGALGGAGAAGAGAAAGTTAAGVGSSAAVASSNASVLTSIAGFIQQAKSVVSSIVTPIADTLHTINGVVQDFNNNVVKPIVGTALQIQNSVNAVRDALERDLSGGIAGLARIPGDIANALGSVDASFTRAMQQLGGVNADIAKRVLVDGLSGGIGQPITDIHTAFAESHEKYLADGQKTPISAFHDLAVVQALKDNVAAIEKRLGDDKGWVAAVVMGLLDCWRVVQYYAALSEPLLGAVQDESRARLHTGNMAVGDAVQAWKRGYISEQAARDEIATSGLSQEKIGVLLQLSSAQAGAGDLVQWRQLGILSPEEYSTLFAMLGYSEGEADRYWRSSFRRAGLGDAVTMARRERSRGDSLTTASLTQPAPDLVRAIAGQNGISAEAADAIWGNTWQLLPPAAAVDALFRGYINRESCEAMLAAAGVPNELMQTYIDLQRPQIPARSVPSLISSGALDAQHGHDMMLAAGYRPEDVELLLRYAGIKIDATTPATADALHGLTQSVVMGLYDDGAIDSAKARDLLVSLGIGSDAAALSIQLHDLESQLAERRATRDLILAEAEAGLLGFDEAGSELLAAGLTTTETERALTKLTKTQSSKTKLPALADLQAMRKKDLIDDQLFMDTAGLLGYSEGWAKLLLALTLS